jgi:hypothetical protein
MCVLSASRFFSSLTLSASGILVVLCLGRLYQCYLPPDQAGEGAGTLQLEAGSLDVERKCLSAAEVFGQ